MSRGYPLVTPALAVDAQVIDASWRTFTPQLMIVGAGTAPNYTSYQGRFMVANNVVRCDILLTGNGGTAGSGAGVINVSLPVLPSPLRLAGLLPAGCFANGTTQNQLYATFSSASVWASLNYLDTTGTPNIAAFPASQQDNAARTIRLHLWYSADLLEP